MERQREGIKDSENAIETLLCPQRTDVYQTKDINRKQKYETKSKSSKPMEKAQTNHDTAFFPEIEMNGNTKHRERINKDKTFSDNGKKLHSDQNRKEKHREQSN